MKAFWPAMVVISATTGRYQSPEGVSLWSPDNIFPCCCSRSPCSMMCVTTDPGERARLHRTVVSLSMPSRQDHQVSHGCLRTEMPGQAPTRGLELADFSSRSRKDDITYETFYPQQNPAGWCLRDEKDWRYLPSHQSHEGSYLRDPIPL